jgi:NADH:ubiquinone oxidoreductase subunit E
MTLEEVRELLEAEVLVGANLHEIEVGEHVVRVATGTACCVKRAARIPEPLKKESLDAQD